MTDTHSGSPYAPHTDAETAAMLETIGVDSEADLFDVPEAIRFDGSFGIDGKSEQATKQELTATLKRNDHLLSFLGRGHYAHYVPSIVDDLSSRGEFLTSYTQYQPEVAQGFLQVLFEYQSMLAELTGLGVANCSMYDYATALGEAATLSNRVRETTGHRVLVPETLRDQRRDVLVNYAQGSDLVVDAYPMDAGNVDIESLREAADEDVVMVYAENPTVSGAIEEHLDDIGSIAHTQDALFCLGTDLVALGLLESPASVGADVVVGDAGALGLGSAYGMSHGLFATREDFLRQVPGRLVGASEDDSGRRAYTLTLQTREQHIRRERATSNICTNQAWVALRTAIHLAVLGPEGLYEMACDCVQRARELAAEIDELKGYRAPVQDRHHFREFQVKTDQPAAAIREDLQERDIAVHAVGEHRLQVCVTEANAHGTDRLLAALSEVA